MATALDTLTGLRKAAILMVTLGADASAAIMRQLSEPEIEELTIEISKIRELTPTTVEGVLEEFSQLAQARSYIVQGGVSYAREVLLKAVGNQRTDEILDRLQVSLQPQLSEEIRRLMFTFDDIARLDDRSMQRLLKEVDQKELARALKAAAESVAQKIFANLSERAQTMLRQEIEYLGPVRLRDVEDAQGKIVRIVRALEEAGEIIVLGKQETGDVFV